MENEKFRNLLKLLEGTDEDREIWENLVTIDDIYPNAKDFINFHAYWMTVYNQENNESEEEYKKADIITDFTIKYLWGEKFKEKCESWYKNWKK